MSRIKIEEGSSAAFAWEMHAARDCLPVERSPWGVLEGRGVGKGRDGAAERAAGSFVRLSSFRRGRSHTLPHSPTALVGRGGNRVQKSDEWPTLLLNWNTHERVHLAPSNWTLAAALALWQCVSPTLASGAPLHDAGCTRMFKIPIMKIMAFDALKISTVSDVLYSYYKCIIG